MTHLDLSCNSSGWWFTRWRSYIIWSVPSPSVDDSSTILALAVWATEQISGGWVVWVAYVLLVV
jgi:hypothetical protein